MKTLFNIDVTDLLIVFVFYQAAFGLTQSRVFNDDVSFEWL